MVNRMLWVLLAGLVLGSGCDCGKRATSTEATKRRLTRVSKRDKVRKPQQHKFLAASEIVIAYQSAKKAPPGVKRGQLEAEELAENLVSRLRSNPEIFDELARKYSDGATKSMGGYLGAWPRGRMPKPLEDALDKLEINGISKPINTPRGVRVLKRELAVLGGSKILISFRGAPGAGNRVHRNKIEARKLAQKLYEQLKQQPSRFTRVAREQSDDRATARRGGRLGHWPRGRRSAAVERTLDRLEIDQIAKPVEVPQGFLILRRDDPYPYK